MPVGWTARIAFGFVALLFVLQFSACAPQQNETTPDTSQIDCTADSDCGAFERCRWYSDTQSRCVSTRQCDSTRDCPDTGDICFDGKCVASNLCEHHRDCDPGYFCDPDLKQCVEIGELPDETDGDRDGEYGNDPDADIELDGDNEGEQDQESDSESDTSMYAIWPGERSATDEYGVFSVDDCTCSAIDMCCDGCYAINPDVICKVDTVWGHCADGRCRAIVESCTGQPDGTACDDGDPKTRYDTCFDATCIGQVLAGEGICRSSTDCGPEGICQFEGRSLYQEGVCVRAKPVGSLGGDIEDFRFTPNGRFVLVQAADEWRLYTTADWRLVRRINILVDKLNEIALTDRYIYAAACVNYQTLNLGGMYPLLVEWCEAGGLLRVDLKTGQPERMLTPYNHEFFALGVLPGSGDLLISACSEAVPGYYGVKYCEETSLLYYDKSTGRYTRLHVSDGSSQAIRKIVSSKDGAVTLIASNNALWQIDVTSGELMLIENRFDIVNFALSPAGDMLAIDWEDHELQLIRLAGDVRYTIPANPWNDNMRFTSLSFSDDGLLLLVATTSGDVGLIDVAQKSLRWVRESTGTPAAFFGSESRPFAADDDRLLELHGGAGPVALRLAGNGRAARDLKFDEDGKTLGALIPAERSQQFIMRRDYSLQSGAISNQLSFYGPDLGLEVVWSPDWSWVARVRRLDETALSYSVILHDLNFNGQAISALNADHIIHAFVNTANPDVLWTSTEVETTKREIASLDPLTPVPAGNVMVHPFDASADGRIVGGRVITDQRRIIVWDLETDEIKCDIDFEFFEEAFIRTQATDLSSVRISLDGGSFVVSATGTAMYRRGHPVYTTPTVAVQLFDTETCESIIHAEWNDEVRAYLHPAVESGFFITLDSRLLHLDTESGAFTTWDMPAVSAVRRDSETGTLLIGQGNGDISILYPN